MASVYNVFRALVKADGLKLTRNQLQLAWAKYKPLFRSEALASTRLPGDPTDPDNWRGDKDLTVRALRNNPTFMSTFRSRIRGIVQTPEGQAQTMTQSEIPRLRNQTAIMSSAVGDTIIGNPDRDRATNDMREFAAPIMGAREVQLSPNEEKETAEVAASFSVVPDENAEGVGALNDLNTDNHRWEDKEQHREVGDEPGFDRSQDLHLDIFRPVIQEYREQLDAAQLMNPIVFLEEEEENTERAYKRQRTNPIEVVPGSFAPDNDPKMLPRAMEERIFKPVYETPYSDNYSWRPVFDDASMFDKDPFRSIHDSWRTQSFIV